MKLVSKISVGLNLALIGSLVLVLAEQRKGTTVPEPAPATVAAARPEATAIPSPPMPLPEVVPQPFRWSQLEGTNGYWIFIANLRASGCPEATLEDIVRGDIDRAFSWERNRLGLNDSGTGPWSESQENQLIASLLGAKSANSAAAPVPETGNAAEDNNGGGSGETASSQSTAPKTPLFLQDVNWSALGFNASQQAAIAQVRQQYQNAMNAQNQNSGSTASQNSTPASENDGNVNPGGGQNSSSAGQNNGGATPQPSTETALQIADDQLRGLLGAQAYAAYEQQQYYLWYQPQVMASGGGPMTLNLPAFSPK